MALTETLTETIICNRALARIGSKPNIENIESDTTLEATRAAQFYVSTRDALLRSHPWRFAVGRIDLVSNWVTATAYTTDQYVWEDSVLYKCAIPHTSGTFATDLASVYWTAITARPAFQWTYAYELPVDFMRNRSFYDQTETYALEGSQLLTDETAVELLYVKQITDPTKFDSLFAEVLVLQLAHHLAMSLSQDKELRLEIANELAIAMAHVRTVDKQEQNTVGRSNLETWNDSRRSSSSTPITITNIPDGGFAL